MIAPMRGQHVDAVVAVHRAGFPGFFLSFLGPRFLRLYYEAIAAYPGAAAYVWLEGERVVGFVSGTANPSAFYGHLLRTRWLRFALAALGAALRRPAIIPRLFRAWSVPGQASGRADTATLTSIAVEPASQGRGIGTRLVAAFLEAMRARGVRRVDLLTDRDGNDAAHALYQKMGFRCECTTVTPEGRAMSLYAIDLAGEPP